MFIVQPHRKFHIPCTSGPLVVTFKLKLRENFTLQLYVFTFYKGTIFFETLLPNILNSYIKWY